MANMHRAKGSIEKNCHIIFDSIEEGVFTVDLEWKITSFNRAAEKIQKAFRFYIFGKQNPAGVDLEGFRDP